MAFLGHQVDGDLVYPAQKLNGFSCVLHLQVGQCTVSLSCNFEFPEAFIVVNFCMCQVLLTVLLPKFDIPATPSHISVYLKP
jgi:hypothetical protein